MMNVMISVAALISYLFFIVRFAWQGIIWFRASGHAAAYPVFLKKVPASVYSSTLLDILFFRKIFNTSKLLWAGSWVFHVSFFFVALRHMRYFFPSLPDCLILLQPVGVVAGYLLPLSLLFLMALRTVKKKDRYVSSYNYFISGMLLFISSIGLTMRMFFRPDLLSVKQFSLGIFGLSPQALPDSALFLFHLALFLLLLPYLPTHIIAAPFVNLEVNRRMEELRYVIHEK
jgi:nitrate reductase gamma subunit